MKHHIIIHPFLFAVYTILGVYSRNEAEIPIQWVLRPLLFLLIVVAIIFIIAMIWSNDIHRAGLITTLMLFWIFFGHFHRPLYEKSPYWNTPLGIFMAFTLWTTPLVLLGSTWVWKRISLRSFISSFMNLTSAIVVIFPAYITGGSFIQTVNYETAYEAHRASNPSLVLDQQLVQPDIYLIILDAYGRADFLQEIYGFDNHEFIDYLKNKGFYVAEQSTPNYPQTGLSLASLLNVQYLDDFAKDFQNTNARGPLYALLQDSEVRRSLHSVGYSFVALPSATLFTQIRDADFYYGMTLGNLNEFEGLLLSSTIANFVIDALNLDVPVPGYELHRRYTSFSLSTLETIPIIEGPKFVFAHIMAPHPPFIFDEYGNPVQADRPYNMGDASGFMGTPDEYAAGYVGEMRYLNRRLMSVVDAIISQTDQPPIIIIQGDHGPGNYFNMIEPENDCLWERYSMLNAYYFPDGNYDSLYSTITPVNSFRVILNQYFGKNLEYLDDKNYYATWLKPYIFSEVTDQISTCQIASKE